jgi:hypothetical protein
VRLWRGIGGIATLTQRLQSCLHGDGRNGRCNHTVLAGRDPRFFRVPAGRFDLLRLLAHAGGPFCRRQIGARGGGAQTEKPGSK